MRMVPLGEIVDFYSGGTPPKATAELWDGDVPWFSAKDMKQPRLTDSADHVSESVFSTTSLRRLPAGTVVMVVRGMILAHTVPISILDVPAAINQDLKALIPRRPVDPPFLAAMLRAQHANILARVSTAAHGTKKLDTHVLQNLRVPLPSLHEQRRIVAILDQADELCAKRRAAIAELDTLTESIFVEMFGDPSGYVTKALGESDIAAVQGGLTLNARRSRLPESHPYLRVANVFRGRMDLAELKTTGVTEPEKVRCALRRGDVLVVEGHGNRGELGRAAECPATVEGYLHQNHLIRVRPAPGVLDPSYLEHFLNSREGRRQIAERAKTTSGLNTISISNVRSIQVPIPEYSRQAEFARVVAAQRRVFASLKRSLSMADSLRLSLRARAFSGSL